MAIVKMKRLRVIAPSCQKDALLDALVRLGCVEISEPGEELTDERWASLLRRNESALLRTKSRITDVNSAMAAIQKYGKVGGGLLTRRPCIDEDAFFAVQAEGVSAEVNGLLQSLDKLQTEEGKLTARSQSLRPWLSLDMPLEQEGSRTCVFRLAVCPAGVDSGTLRTALADTAAEIFEVSSDKQQRYLLLIAHREEETQALELLRPHGLSLTSFKDITGTARENIDRMESELADNRRRQEELRQAIMAHQDDWQTLCTYADRLSVEAARDASAERLMTDGTIVCFAGWAPAEAMGKVGALLDEKGCAWEAEDPKPEEYPQVPVQLKNNAFTRPLNMVTEMYSLPAYDGVDPNPLMAPFFIFFYGFMLADMGYGLLMMLAALVIMKKAPPNGATMRHMIPLLGLCGVSTFIMGALTGGFFGDMLPQLAKLINPNTTFTAMPALFSPLNDALAVLIGSLCIGVVQIFTGMAISMYRQIKRGEVMAAICNEGAWYLVFVLIGVGIAIGQIKYALIAVAVLLVLTQGYGKKGIAGKLMGIGGSLYNNITGYFSDILSYSRLMALMLAGAVIAQVFNTLGAITGNVITFFLISMVGNALNFALNLLGCYVHDMRLQCLEFFSRFYSDGGKPFRPLDMTTKYVDIVKK